MKNFLIITYECILHLFFVLPRYRFLNPIKLFPLRLIGARIGKRLDLYPGVWISTGQNLVVGDDVVLARDVLLTTNGGLHIGNRTMIGYRSQILSANHHVPPAGYPISRSGNIFSPVIIGDDVWIGAGCIILPGATIGQGSVVAAGSVVTKNLVPYGIYAGVPAKLIKMRADPV